MMKSQAERGSVDTYIAMSQNVVYAPPTEQSQLVPFYNSIQFILYQVCQTPSTTVLLSDKLTVIHEASDGI